MYRNYEDAKAIRKQIEELKIRMSHTDDDSELVGLHEELEELIDRENFAWQDESE